MFDFIRKADYFDWVERYRSSRDTYASASTHNLKDIQDHFALSRLDGARGMRVLEVGGADCRAMRTIADHNECWNADRFEGQGGGPARVIETPGVRNALTFLGEFSAELPDAYFDIVFSLSVIEHVDTADLAGMFRDIARVLKPGGRTFHAIDVYLFDPDRWSETQADYTRRRLEAYLSVPGLTDGGLQFVVPPRVDASPGFSCEYASNADREMLVWNKVVPALSEMRLVAQSCSVMAEWVRT